MRTTRDILRDASTIAVVGASPDRHDDAHWKPKQMQQFGWRIIPVNTGADEILGEHSYPRLTDIPAPVDIVDVFDTPQDATQIVRDAIDIGAKSVWLEPHHDHPAHSPEARQLAAQAGVDYLEDRSAATERAIAGMVHRNTQP